jgi:transcriptional regulator with XRE-family HTH domain
MDITGCDIVKRVDEIAQKKGISRKHVLIDLGMNPSSFTDWSKRGTIPSADKALKVADYLGVSIRWLLTGEDEYGLSRDERNLLSFWDRLTEDNQRMLLAWLDTTLTVQDERAPQKSGAVGVAEKKQFAG